MTNTLGNEFMPHVPPQLDDPFPFYARLRRQAPVVFAPAFNLFLVSKYQDVVACLKDTRRFSSEQVLVSPMQFPPEVKALLEEAGFSQQYPLVGEDPPAHTRTRGLANKAFSPARIAAMGPRIQQIVQECLDTLEREGGGRADVVPYLTHPLPLRVSCELMGIARKDMDYVGAVCEQPLFLFHPGNTPEQQLRIARDVAGYWHFLTDLVEDRRRHPREDDILTILIQSHAEGEKPMDTRDVVNLIASIMFGSMKPTSHLLSSMLLYLLRQRESWEAICENPALIPQAIEETVRYDAPASAMMRSVTEDVVLSGTRVPKGARLLLLFASANRDEEMFNEPDRFDITRESAHRHLGFGHGTHSCLGVVLARMEVRIAMEMLTRRMPHLRLVPGEPPVYLPDILARGPQRLVVQWH